MVSIDQLVWVKEEEKDPWIIRYFAQWPEDTSDYAAIYCWAGTGTTSKTAEGDHDVYGWPYYSLTDPNITEIEVWFL